jgi:hypothetical protein
LTMSTTIAAFASKMEQLGALMREIYGCSFNEYFEKILQGTFAGGFDRGLYDGYRLGKSDGRRAEKGVRTTPRRRGKPSNMDEDVARLMVYEVSRAVAGGDTVHGSVISFLKTMEAGYRELSDPTRLPNQKAAEQVYYRLRRSGTSRSSHQKSYDDALRFRISELNKK